jgi:hypothetical protein
MRRKAQHVAAAPTGGQKAETDLAIARASVTITREQYRNFLFQKTP